LNKQALREAAEGNVKYSQMFIHPRDLLALLDELEAKDKRIAELESYSKTALEFREAARDENRHLKLELEILENHIADQHGIILSARNFISEYAVKGDIGAAEFVKILDRAAGIGVKGE
ncbi:hypothetical protein HMPREF3212_01283, partial [Citrobacter freundii]